MERKRNQNYKKYVSALLCMTLIISATVFSFAGEDMKSKSIGTNDVITQIEKWYGPSNMVKQIRIDNNNFVPKTKSVEVSIPKRGVEPIEMSIGDENIQMFLPDEVKNSNGLLTNEGYIVYDTGKAVDAIVQTTAESLNNETRTTVRTMLTIENSDASKQYYFNYELPQGYYLMMGDELGNRDIPNDAVGIVNKEGYVVAIIDSPWAKDANGEAVPTAYSIEGDTLIQTIQFDDNTLFPVTADPSTIVDTRTSTKTKKVDTTWMTSTHQLVDGYSFQSGGSVGWWEGAGNNKTISFVSEFTGKNFNATFTLGLVKSQTSGATLSVFFPPSSTRKKVQEKCTLIITEKTTENKYRNTTITDNGKTTTTTYEWVTVRHWVDKVVKTGLDTRLINA